MVSFEGDYMETIEIGQDSALVALRGKVDGVMVPTVIDEPTMQSAAGLLVQLKRMEKEVKEREAFLLGPLKKHVKTIGEHLKLHYYDPISTVSRQVRESIESYQNDVAAKERDRLTAIARIEADNRRKEAEAKLGEADTMAVFGILASPIVLTPATVTEADMPATNTHAAGGSVYNKTDWDFEVTDLDAVPIKYVKREVRRADVLAALKRGEEIPGIKGIKTIGIGVIT